jgi:YHS domain-containing protein
MVRVTEVHARGEDHRVVQLVGNLFVCSRANGSCCCGWEEKGREPFANELWSAEWERRLIRNRVHLTFTGCLGPCVAGNNAMLQIYGRSFWLNDLNSPALVPLVFDYIAEMLSSGEAFLPQGELATHLIARYLDGSETVDSDGAGVLDCDDIDPVCLMTVDPATAKFKADFEGRTVYFCAPSCRKLFMEDPSAYLTVG